MKRVEVVVFLALMMAVVWTFSGCQPAEPQADPGVTTPDDEAALPELPDDPAADPGAGTKTVDTGAAGTQAATGGETAGTETAGTETAGTETAGTETAGDQPATSGGAMPDLVAIDIELPAPAFRGTPVPLAEPNVEKPLGKPRPAFLAPKGTVNLSRGKPVFASDRTPAAGEVDFVVDGDKEASDFGYLELSPGTQWVQIDLGQRAAVYAVLLWHNHADARVYRDVIVQVSDEPDFINAVTVFNNDYDGSSGLGVGGEMGYVETSEGKLIDCGGVEGRYVRLYSRGSHLDEKNHYTEVEVFGKPVE